MQAIISTSKYFLFGSYGIFQNVTYSAKRFGRTVATLIIFCSNFSFYFRPKQNINLFQPHWVTNKKSQWEGFQINIFEKYVGNKNENNVICHSFLSTFRVYFIWPYSQCISIHIYLYVYDDSWVERVKYISWTAPASPPPPLLYHNHLNPQNIVICSSQQCLMMEYQRKYRQ